jgi:hypothetical protein
MAGTATIAWINNSSTIYATWDPAAKASGITLSGGDLTALASDADVYSVISTIGKSSGKWYCEVTYNTLVAATATSIGVRLNSESLTSLVGSSTSGYGYNDVGEKKTNGVDTSYGGTPANGSVIGILLNMDDGEISFRWNNNDYGVAFTGLSGTFYVGFSSGYGANQVTANFGASAFVYSVPAGYNSGLYN